MNKRTAVLSGIFAMLAVATSIGIVAMFEKPIKKAPPGRVEYLEEVEETPTELIEETEPTTLTVEELTGEKPTEQIEISEEEQGSMVPMVTEEELNELMKELQSLEKKEEEEKGMIEKKIQEEFPQYRSEYQ